MQIENPIDTTENCRYCLMCRHVCPVGHVTRLETLTPHGWGLTIQSVKRGLLAWNEDTVTALYSCADCGTCRAHCVTDQPLPTAIAAARAEVVAAEGAPEAVRRVGEMLSEWSNPYQEQSPAAAEGTGEVALFVGDEAAYLWPDALPAARRLIEGAGVGLVEIGRGRANGYLASSLGFPELARQLAEATLAELEASGARQMLVLSPGDYYAFHQMMDDRLGLTWPQEVELLELTVYLAQRLEAGELAFHQAGEDSLERVDLAYAYVDPTHTVRVPERVEAPRALLGAVMPAPGRELFWRRERAHPSGDGALGFTTPHIADHLTYARLDDVAKSGARRAITEAPGSLSRLNRHARRFGLEIQGLYELLADHVR